MTTQTNHSPVSAKRPSGSAAIAPPVLPDPAPPKVDPARIEGEARGAWYHTQKAVGLLASELERIMTKLFNSLDNRQKPKPRV